MNQVKKKIYPFSHLFSSAIKVWLSKALACQKGVRQPCWVQAYLIFPHLIYLIFEWLERFPYAPKMKTSEHFKCVNQHVLQFHHQRRGHSRLDTVFLVLLLTIRSSSFVAVLIALDVSCRSVIDEPVSEGETWKSPACEGCAILNTDRSNMPSSPEGTSIKGLTYTKSAISHLSVYLGVCFFTNV